ncbi:MAG: hypothetical protein Q7T78_17030 [Rhodoferax sp.]|nr:hypothetical protein [Rhodoferax sp.]
MTGLPFDRLNSLDAHIAALFAAGENGALYERQDLQSQYQDSAGLVPVTAAGQLVGLTLDKRRGLARGPDVLVNGDFTQGATGWTVSGEDATHVATFAGGVLRYQSGTTSPQLAVGNAGAAVVAGDTYEVTAFCSQYVSGSVKLFEQAGFGNLTVNGVGTFRARLRAVGGGLTITRATANVDLTLDWVTACPIYGNHATQLTAGFKPAYQAGPARLVFDGADDALTTTFSSALGSNCTVVRSVPGTGAVILMGQTIGTSYADSTTNSGLLIIDRPLTTAETALVVRWGNQRAGV